MNKRGERRQAECKELYLNVIEESANYAVVRFPTVAVDTLKGGLNLLESIRAKGLRPLHRLDMNTTYQDCFMCEKTAKYTRE